MTILTVLVAILAFPAAVAGLRLCFRGASHSIVRGAYGGLFGTLALATAQGDIGPLSFLKPIEIRIGIIILLLFFAGFQRMRETVGGDGTQSWPVYTVVSAFALLSAVPLLSGDVPDTQLLLLALYMAPVLIVSVSPSHLRSAALPGVLVACFFQVVLALLLGPYVYTLSGIPQLSGGLQPNIIALAAGFSLSWGVWLALQGGKSFVVSGICITIISVIAVYSSVSRTGLIVAACSLLLLLFFDEGRRSRVVGICIALVSFLALSVSSQLQGAALSWFVRGDEGSIASLTGRTSIWDRAYYYWNVKPLLGWGFGGLYSTGSSAGTFLSEVRGVNAHNAALQLLVETGIFGLTLMVVVFLLTVLALWVGRGRWRSISLALVGALLVNAVGSASFATIGLGWSMFVALIALATSSDESVAYSGGVGSDRGSSLSVTPSPSASSAAIMSGPRFVRNRNSEMMSRLERRISS